jgi:hypothetical protein
LFHPQLIKLFKVLGLNLVSWNMALIDILSRNIVLAFVLQGFWPFSMVTNFLSEVSQYGTFAFFNRMEISIRLS